MTDPEPEKTILSTTKQMLGIPSSDASFDVDIIANLNAAFMSLNQLGLGPDAGFTIEDGTETWSAYLDNPELFGGLESYMYLKTKLIFDPPATSFGLTSAQNLIEELEIRFRLQAELIKSSEEEV